MERLRGNEENTEEME